METAANGKRCAKCDKELPVGHSRARCWACNEEGRTNKTRRPTIAARERTVASRVGQDVDLNMTAHTLEGAARDLASVPSGLGKFEWERMRDDLVSRIELAKRTVEGLARRSK